MQTRPRRSKMATLTIRLGTCLQETIKVVSDVGSDADVVSISALSDDESDVCPVSGDHG